MRKIVQYWMQYEISDLFMYVGLYLCTHIFPGLLNGWKQRIFSFISQKSLQFKKRHSDNGNLFYFFGDKLTNSYMGNGLFIYIIYLFICIINA